MTSQLGATALACGLVSAVTAAVLWFRVGTGGSARAARRTTAVVLASALLACGLLEAALLRHDYAIRFVAENGGPHVPLYYAVTSLWSALEGSLLLWLVVLSAIAVLVGRRATPSARHLQPIATGVITTIGAAFFGVALFAGNPFTRVSPVPGTGPGPNPLLRDHPAMGVHPPLLYLGFVGMVVPFAYACAALVTSDTSSSWVRASRTWLLVAWSALTAGIVLGAWWAYAVLGWGGYWGWDPVENASLLPWLTATALLHSMMAQRREPVLRVWNLSLAGATFVLVLLGTFLTRSGVLASVHSFTQSAVGPTLLGVLLAALGGFAFLLVWRAGQLGSGRPTGPASGRGALLLGNNLALLCLGFTILLGTTYPLLAEALFGSRLSVGAPYFNRTVPPLALVVLVLMAVGPLTSWDGEGTGSLWGQVRVPVWVGLGTVAAVGAAGGRGVRPVLACGLGAAVVTAASLRICSRVSLRRTQRQGWLGAMGRTVWSQHRLVGGMVAHIGIGLACVAVAASSSWTTSREVSTAVGDRVTVAGHSVVLKELDRSRAGDGYTVRATVTTAGGERLRPALVFFPERAVLVSTPAISSSLRSDLYVTVLQASDDGRTALLRVAVNPLVPYLWLAGGLTVLGGLWAARPSGRQRRVASGVIPAQPARDLVSSP